MSSTGADVDLWYGAVRVGRVNDTYCSEATWYGSFKLALDPTVGPLEQRLLEYIDFCMTWHERLDDWNEWYRKERPNPPNSTEPDASEFDNYSDLLATRQWFTKSDDGSSSRIDAPVFFTATDITWRDMDDS